MAAGRRTTRDPVAVREFIESFAETGVASGLPRMPARVFAALLAAEEGSMTAAELAADLEISPAAVSGAVRYLTQTGLAARRRPIGSRRDEYEVVGSWYTLFTQRERVIEQWVDGVRAGADAVGPDTAAGRRLAETAEFFAFLRIELQAMMRRWDRRSGR